MEDSEQLQIMANRLNLGPHQHLLEAEDEQGRAGRWVVHRPTMREEINIAVEYARLKTPVNQVEAVDIDMTYDTMAFMIATLNVVVELRPDWFPKDAGDCYDAGLLGLLFEGYQTWKESFRRQLPRAEAADSSAPESA